MKTGNLNLSIQWKSHFKRSFCIGYSFLSSYMFKYNCGGERGDESTSHVLRWVELLSSWEDHSFWSRVSEPCASGCLGFGVIESNVSDEARGEGGNEWKSQDIHPSVLTIQAVLRILGVSKKTSRSDHLPLRRTLTGVTTRLAALFEQKQTLGKRQLCLLMTRYRGCWAATSALDSTPQWDVTSCCNVAVDRLLRFGMIWRISEHNILWGNITFVVSRSFHAALKTLYRTEPSLICACRAVIRLDAVNLYTSLSN